MTLALDGSSHIRNDSATSLSLNLTTTNANDIICVIITTNGGPVTSVTSPHLTFALRVSSVNFGQPIEFWYAVAANKLVNETITVNITSGSIIVIDAFGVSGANTSAIFDSDPSLPGVGTAAPISISTSNAQDMIIEACRTSGAVNIDAGFTLISGLDFQAVGYQIVSVKQSGLSINMDGAAVNGIIGDAIMQFSVLGPQVETTLTKVPGKAFTRKHYYNELEKIREDNAAVKALLEAMDERGRADHDFELARAVMENFDKNMTPTNYAKAMDARENYEKAKKARDHHYFMEVVKKAWADDEAKKKK